MMMLRVIVLASALALGKAAPSTSRSLAGRELGNRENCDGSPGNQKMCYKGATPDILALDKDEEGSICTREPYSRWNTCHGCLECTDPNEVCEPRANEEHPVFRTFSSMTTSPYWDTNKKGQRSDGPCCASCDSTKHEGKAWKHEDAGVGADPDDARCEWNRYCSGCSECD